MKHEQPRTRGAVPGGSEGLDPTLVVSSNGKDSSRPEINPSLPSREGRPALSVALVTATEPARLCKVFAAAEDGTVHTTTSAQLRDGTVENLEFESLRAFMEFRESLAPNQAFVYGIPAQAPARIVTQARLKKLGADGSPPNGLIARDANHFTWRVGPAIVMVDIDAAASMPGHIAEKLPSTPAGWRELLLSIVPELAKCPMAWAPSSSSFIYNGSEEVHGLRGQRIYFAIGSGADTPRFKERLCTALTLQGLAWCEVSKSGSRLSRFPVDLMVYQPERLDFAARPVCEEPLESRPAPWEIWNDDSPPLKSADLTSPSKSDLDRAKVIEDGLKRQQAAHARAVREQYIRESTRRMMARSSLLEEGVCAETIRQAVDFGRLLSNFLLLDAEGVEVTVGELLKDPIGNAYRRFADPLEPDYRGDTRIAVFLNDKLGQPIIYSHAHGGRMWQCTGDVHAILAGQVHETFASIAAALEHDPAGLYLHGTGIAAVDWQEAAVIPIDADGLGLRLQRKFQVQRDLKLSHLRAVLSDVGSLPLPRITAISRLPFARPDGTPVTEHGLDAETGVLLTADEMTMARMRADLSPAEASAALSTLFEPFRGFVFATARDRAAVLCALLSAVVRPGLTIAPGYMVTAPIQGSGKSLLAGAIGAFQTGARCATSVLPNADEEIRKRLFAMLRQGHSYLFFDNVERGGSIDSPALAGFMTSPFVEDRVLGQTKIERRPNRSTVVLTGNNPRIIGDLRRRIIPIRLDPGMSDPWTRRFDFNPVSRVLSELLPLRTAALELISAWRERGSPRPEYDVGFGEWDTVVRGTLSWIMTLETDLDLEDPGAAIKDANADDPEAEMLGALLEAWHGVVGAEEHILRSLYREVERQLEEEERDAAFDGDASGKTELPAHAFVNLVGEMFSWGDSWHRAKADLGRYLAQFEGRIAGGLKLVGGGTTRGARRWRVVKA